ncbi:SDR family NAD(P)-dependent oxidoreductase [Arcticibacter sp. MXS-1]|uniref:SDR family NAD(P)-dependent oxidoreductase n=1 Tax=Arcticibacter sp. MXS-1 TaxID=3341726 RepID=UPI0035A88DC2
MRKHTAIVTGASEGLGKAIAFELASRGINLVLLSLPGSGLPALSRYIERNFGVNAWYREVDLTLAGELPEIFTWMMKNKVRANMLINNAGLGNWSWFEEKNIYFYKKQIDLNITSTVLLTRLFLDQVSPKNRSYLLNVGSLGGHVIVPRKQVYGASKSFISYFTRCLQLEQSGKNIFITLLSPGGINTKPELLVQNHSLRGLSAASILEPEVVARQAIEGLLKGKKEVIPGAINRTIAILNTLLPSFVKETIIRHRLKAALTSPG